MTHPISTLSVGGLRGLSTRQSITFAKPDGARGSGLTILVGSNNSGKSTVVESLRVLSNRAPNSMSEGRRNRAYGDKVAISIESPEGVFRSLESIRSGGSETRWTTGEHVQPEILVLPSRRTFNAYFPNPGSSLQRLNYAADYTVPSMKSPTIDHFGGRLFKINREQESRAQFDALLGRVIDPVPDWTIDQSDTGQYYLKFRWPAADPDSFHAHSSDGLGEGLVSLFFIIDSLYDSTSQSMTVIDEPELSLHPQFQRRLHELLSEMSSNRQIVYATHSPYFVSWADLEHGATIVRVHKARTGTILSQPSRQTVERVARLSRDQNNPHVLGLDATEVFFLEDNVLLVEGQEDVVHMRKILIDMQIELQGSFFGWGVGGAEKMEAITRLLEEMGYVSVAGVLDNDKRQLRRSLTEKFPRYRFFCIPADDIRPKEERILTAKEGLTDDSGRVRPELLEPTRALFNDLNSYFGDASTPNVSV